MRPPFPGCNRLSPGKMATYIFFGDRKSQLLVTKPTHFKLRSGFFLTPPIGISSFSIGNTSTQSGSIFQPAMLLYQTHTIHVWYIYLHLPKKSTKCRYKNHTWILYGSCGRGYCETVVVSNIKNGGILTQIFSSSCRGKPTPAPKIAGFFSGFVGNPSYF